MESELVKGHSGILKVTLDGKEVFNNKNECSSLPGNEFILEKIEKSMS